MGETLCEHLKGSPMPPPQLPRPRRLGARAALIFIPVVVLLAAALAAAWPRQVTAPGPVFTASCATDRGLVNCPDQHLPSGAVDRAFQLQELSLRREDRLSILLRPLHKDSGIVEVGVFRRPRGGLPRAWALQPEPQDDGSFLLSRAVEDLRDLEREQDLLFVFARPGSLPAADALRRDLAAEPYSVLTIHLKIVD